MDFMHKTKKHQCQLCPRNLPFHEILILEIP
jgi:hypothetical protein